MSVQLFIGGLNLFYELADHEIKLNNYDYPELFKSFFNLTWAEDLIVSKGFSKALNEIEKKDDSKLTTYARAAMALLEIVESNNNLKKLTIHTEKTKPFTEKISKRIDQDLRSIKKPIKKEENVPNGFAYNNSNWCHIKIASYYSAIKVCNDLNCTLSADNDFYRYFELLNKPKYINSNAVNDAFAAYFKMHIPQLFPTISIGELQCFACKRIVSCKNCGEAWEKKKIYMEGWKIRCGDEFAELREEVGKIKSQLEVLDLDRDAIYSKLEQKRKKCQKISSRLNSLSNILNIITPPASFMLGCVADTPLLVSLGAGMALAPIASHKAQSVYYNKNKLALFHNL
ncbi:hypothetical protein [Maridesulfovibrio sp.]|uniref:hypothetical protein n=1 Tax=Maridesulfovibrio sp. TaxID=2795000 RepID=UPI003BAAAD5D